MVPEAQRKVQPIPVRGTMIPCDDLKACDNLWGLAEAFLKSSQLEMNYNRGNILVSGLPDVTRPISLHFVRVHTEYPKETLLILAQCEYAPDVLCQDAKTIALVDQFKDHLEKSWTQR